MSHVVLVGGPQLGPIMALLGREVPLGANWWIGVLPTEDATSLDYRDSNDPLPALVTRLESGELASIHMRYEGPSQLLIGIYRPNFCSEAPDLWRCIVEGSPDDATRLYAACRGGDGMAFVALSVDEAPEFSATQVSVDTFPWDDWHLVRAAVRATDDHWEERDGRAGDPRQLLLPVDDN
jgi:hypothetical protein